MTTPATPTGDGPADARDPRLQPAGPRPGTPLQPRTGAQPKAERQPDLRPRTGAETNDRMRSAAQAAAPQLREAAETHAASEDWANRHGLSKDERAGGTPAIHRLKPGERTPDPADKYADHYTPSRSPAVRGAGRPVGGGPPRAAAPQPAQTR